MREQGLLVHEGGADKVSAGAILLFGKNPQEFFPQAIISVTEAGKKRELFEGNLITQHRSKRLSDLSASNRGPQYTPA